MISPSNFAGNIESLFEIISENKKDEHTAI